MFVLFWFQLFRNLVRALILNIHIGIHLNKTSDKLVYYYLYYEEASFRVNTCTHILIRIFLFLYKQNIYPFEVKITITYNDTS